MTPSGVVRNRSVILITVCHQRQRGSRL